MLPQVWTVGNSQGWLHSIQGSVLSFLKEEQGDSAQAEKPETFSLTLVFESFSLKASVSSYFLLIAMLVYI